MKRSFIALFAALAVVACTSDETLAPTELTELSASAAKAPGGWVHMATGGGQDLYPGSTVSDFQISFQAKEDANGQDVGSVNWTDPITGTTIASGHVDCLLVTGNKAWIRYVANINGADFHVYIGFEDNGQGRQAAADRHTFIYGGPVSPTNATCEFFAETDGFGTGFPVEWRRGNVQVR